MLKHIPILSDYFVSKKDYNNLELEYERLRNELFLQKEINLILEKKTKIVTIEEKTKIVTIAGFDDNEAEPSDPIIREGYVKEVDIFYENILKKKLITSIADIRELLSNIHVANGFPQNMQRNEYDFFLRGMESFAWKINEWATTLQGERRENLQDKENQ